MDRLLLGTRKGTIILDRNGAGWKVGDVGHYGVNVSLVARDPRDGTLWAGLDHGHWGTKLSRSTDNGKTWADAPQIMYPEDARYIDGFEQDENGEDKTPKIKSATLGKIWSIAFGGADQPGRIWVGTIPGGLFRSDDGGETWELNRPLWEHDSRGGPNLDKPSNWFGGGATVNGESTPGIHSIVVDPRNSKRVLVGVSCAGVLETTDDGKTWVGRNKGLKATFLPNPDAEWGHDPHLVSLSPNQPDHVWQQNHCGVFYSPNGGQEWQEVSRPDQGVHFGFPVAVDEKDGRTAWLVPGRSDAQRMSVNAGLFVARTQDGGKTWEQLREGLPQERAHDIVYRHSLDIKGDMLAFGSTTGNLYFSPNRGESWHTVSNNLPPIHSVRFAEAGATKSPSQKPRGAKKKAAPKNKPANKTKTKAHRVSGGAKKAKAPAKKKAATSPSRKAGGTKKKATAKKKPANKTQTKARRVSGGAKTTKPAAKKKAKQSPARKGGGAKKKAAPRKAAAKKAPAKKKPVKKKAAPKKKAATSPGRKAGGAKKKAAPKNKPAKKKAPAKKANNNKR